MLVLRLNAIHSMCEHAADTIQEKNIFGLNRPTKRLLPHTTTNVRMGFIQFCWQLRSLDRDVVDDNDDHDNEVDVVHFIYF